MLACVFGGSAVFGIDTLNKRGPRGLWETLEVLLMYAPVAGVVGAFTVFVYTRVGKFIRRHKNLLKQEETGNDANG